MSAAFTDRDAALRAVFLVPPPMVGVERELTDVERGDLALRMFEACGFDPLAMRNPLIDEAWLRRYRIVEEYRLQSTMGAK